MSNFWTVQFLKTESEPNFGFPHIPTERPFVGVSTISQIIALLEKR